jgi:hypothetical protein
MTPPPTSIDGTDITGATIDGQDVQEITVDGDTVFRAVAPVNRMYVSDFNNNLVRQFDLTNKFDLTGATQTATLSLGDQRDVVIADSGNRAIVSNFGGGRQEMYSLSTPYDISSAGSVTSTLSEVKAHGVSIDTSGVHLMSSAEDSQEFSYYTLGTAFDLNTASFQDSASVGDRVYDVDYVNKGEFVFGASNQYQVNRWELTTPFDFTTRTNKQEYSIPVNFRGIHVTDDGSKYFSADFGGEVNEFNLSTPYDISSRGSIVDTFSVPNAIGVDFV